MGIGKSKLGSIVDELNSTNSRLCNELEKANATNEGLDNKLTLIKSEYVELTNTNMDLTTKHAETQKSMVNDKAAYDKQIDSLMKELMSENQGLSNQLAEAMQLLVIEKAAFEKNTVELQSYHKDQLSDTTVVYEQKFDELSKAHNETRLELQKYKLLADSGDDDIDDE